VKGVVDGDFCGLFEGLTEGEKARVGSALGREPKDIAALLFAMNSKFK
jgi:hypothetical protein